MHLRSASRNMTLSMASTASSLLDMPNELLINITQYVDAGGLKALCLTCQHLRSIAQGFIVKIAILSPSKIWKLVDTLVTRPEFAKGFTQLRLGPMSQETHDKMKEYGKARFTVLTTVDKTAYRKFLRNVYGGGERSSVLRTANLFKDNPTSIGLALLFALAPGLRSISMGTGSLESIPLLANIFGDKEADLLPAGVPELHRLVQTYLQDRLEELTIFQEEVIIKIKAGPLSKSATQYHKRLTLNVQPFQVLKHLVAPFWLVTYTHGLRQRYNGSFDPRHNLPASLVCIRTVHASRWQVLGIGWTDDLIMNTYFHNLTTVKMQFHGSFWQTAALFASNEGLAPNVVPSLNRWSESRVVLEMLFDHKVGRPASGADVFAQAIQRCRGASLTELCKDPEILAEIGIPRPELVE